MYFDDDCVILNHVSHQLVCILPQLTPHIILTYLLKITSTGKLDSDSEDDLAEIATLLHKQNTVRKMKELEQREKYNAGDPGGNHNWNDNKPYVPRSYSPYTSKSCSVSAR